VLRQHRGAPRHDGVEDRHRRCRVESARPRGQGRGKQREDGGYVGRTARVGWSRCLIPGGAHVGGYELLWLPLLALGWFLSFSWARADCGLGG
jgi:hypothetical protein